MRADGGYAVTYEKLPGIVLAGGDWARIFHRAGNVPVYAYSAVFAPTDLKTKIFHRWMYKDEKSGKWIATDQLGFSISGGRDGGWRGFTFKRNVFAGRWRVEVITERGQVLGRATFRVVAVAAPPDLVSVMR